MAAQTYALRHGWGLRASIALFLAVWVVIAAFPLVWIAAMSIKDPVDAFSADPVRVLLGPATRAAAGGLSLLDLLIPATVPLSIRV